MYQRTRKKCLFDNPAESVFQKAESVFAQRPKLMQKNLNFLEIKLSSNCSIGHVVCILDNPVEDFLTNDRNQFGQLPKMIKDYILFSK